MADKKEYKSVWLTLDTQLYYAQVFEQNRDMGSMHSDTDGVTKVTLRLDDWQIAKLMSLGVEEQYMGHQTFKDLTIGDETFRTYVAKRPWISKYLKDDDGKRVVMGAPVVFDYNKAVEAYNAAGANGIMRDEYITPWTMEDGLIGNGSTGKVKLSIYRGMKNGKPICIPHLEKIAITSLVPYEGKSGGGVMF